MFINHLIYGTVNVLSTLPKDGSKRFKLLDDYFNRISKEMSDKDRFSSSFCMKCGKHLFNPQSKLMHIGNACKNLN